jgi:hypothetical protein
MFKAALREKAKTLELQTQTSNFKLQTSSHSPASTRTSFPRGRHSANTFPKSSEVKSGPAVAGLSPLRLI